MLSTNIKEIVENAKTNLDLLKHMPRYVNRKVLEQMYKMYLSPHLDYGDIIYFNYKPAPLNINGDL